ncbi:MAG TPA: hypothetical protein VI894_02990, partial [Candidatus Nanoarchaeia archaeon]|nr:hypothetical protein [Candidatus Nanoarchaeia archaeon]
MTYLITYSMTCTSRILFIVLIILTAIFSAPTLAAALTVDRPEPLITVKFDEPVSFINASIINSANSIIPVNLISKSSDNTTYVFRPGTQLSDGNYVFRIYGKDILGNVGNLREESFDV